ncbi:MAG: DUF4159 domain-containing protein [Vicinamibacterales bacterium]
MHARWLPGFRRSAVAKTAVGVALLLAVVTSVAAAQRRGGGGGFGGGRSARIDTSWVYDGRFVFCRIAFQNSPDGDGSGWQVDYPRADMNFPFRLGELSSTPISHNAQGEPNHVVLTLTDPHLFQCPFVMMTEPGGALIRDDEAVKLREYLDKGGFLWVDDFWGEYAWAHWERELRKVLPAAEFPIKDLPLDHPIFKTSYVITSIPQIPSLNNWLSSGGLTYERRDATVPHLRAVENASGDVMVLMTHNTDLGDAWEREGFDRAYFEEFAARGYALGVNVFLYAMTH